MTLFRGHNNDEGHDNSTRHKCTIKEHGSFFPWIQMQHEGAVFLNKKRVANLVHMDLCLVTSNSCLVSCLKFLQ